MLSYLQNRSGRDRRVRGGNRALPVFHGGRGARAALLGALVAIIAFAVAACARGGVREWNLAVYGTGANPDAVSFRGSYGAGELALDVAGSGKMVTYGADGLAFYYAELDARRDNFVLSATMVVDSWTMTNGEDDGFGLMVCDAVAESGDGRDFWNNSCMAAVTKVEYAWNSQTQAASNVGEPIVMRQGIVAREKIGSTQAYPEDQMRAAATQRVTNRTLESSQGARGAGTYNLIGNCTPIADGGGTRAPAGTVEDDELLTEIRLEIRRDNTGYRVRYIEENETIHEELFYDLRRDKLAAIDSNNIYVGFFVARQANIRFRDMELTVTEAARDEDAEAWVPETVDPDFQITSSATANSESYELIFETNYPGTLTVRDAQGAIIAGGIALEENGRAAVACVLREGDNLYAIEFVPDAGADGTMVLSDMSTVALQHSVSYRRIGDVLGNIHTAPDASGEGLGTDDSPIGLAEAVKYAAPGQTILLHEGVYLFAEPLNIERGHDGTQAEPISLISHPDNSSRPVLDFARRSAGIILSANHWYLRGFDCTGTASNEYGIHLTGSHNTLERLEIYRNGNTGLHVSSLSLWDEKVLWPSDNFILNCTSYGNCDDAYEDADGFACQFTAGPGNVFDGCVAHHNSDDGWDLYAKVWLAPVGPVTIRNCIAYANGFLEDGTPAGNGNGFKLGGDGMPGGHVVENCLSFGNGANGFTSNSCPDIALTGCTSIDNDGTNIRLYARNQPNTAFTLQNICSLRAETVPGAKDSIALEGTQNPQAVYNETAYYWNPDEGAALNGAGARVEAGELYASSEFVEGVSIVRTEDGSIALQGDFLRPLTGEPMGAVFTRIEERAQN